MSNSLTLEIGRDNGRGFHCVSLFQEVESGVNEDFWDIEFEEERDIVPVTD